MITHEKLQLYASFHGDLDGWSRSGVDDREGRISQADWQLIDELRQALALVRAGASLEFTRALEARLTAVTADEQTREALRRLAAT
jgi:hypothetical protein